MIDYEQQVAEYAEHRQVHPGVLQGLLRTGGITEKARVLEVGCGTGNYVGAIHAATRCRCWGIDRSERMLSHARQQSPAVQYEIGDAEQLELPSRMFDLVFCVDVIHHLREPAAFFAAAFDSLVPGGRLCTVTDSEWIIRHRQPLAVYFPETVDVELSRYHSVGELMSQLRQSGFAELRDAVVEWPYELVDIGPYRDQAFSVLHLIDDGAFRRGLRRMERDLARGAIGCVSRYVMIWGHKPDRDASGA